MAKDEAEAVKWYRKAAEQNYAIAQYNLGICYANGDGVAKDDAEAVSGFAKPPSRITPWLNSISAFATALAEAWQRMKRKR